MIVHATRYASVVACTTVSCTAPFPRTVAVTRRECHYAFIPPHTIEPAKINGDKDGVVPANAEQTNRRTAIIGAK